MPNSDKNIIKDLNIGNNPFEQIYKTYICYLCSFAKKIVGDKETAEDIVHDFFEIFWKMRETVQLNTSQTAYMTKSIHNKCIKYLKKNKVLRKYDKYIKIGYKTYDNNTPLFIIILKETKYEIDKAINSLPQKCREILMLWDDGFSYKEIADKLHISSKTVDTQILIAKIKLQNQLQGKNNLIFYFFFRDFFMRNGLIIK